MTVSSYKKLLRQISTKKDKYKHYLKFNKPRDRKFGKNTKECVRCGSKRGHISKYGIDLCRRCFRQVATKIGFKKYS